MPKTCSSNFVKLFLSSFCLCVSVFAAASPPTFSTNQSYESIGLIGSSSVYGAVTNNTLDLDGEQVTIAAWVKPNSTSNGEIFIKNAQNPAAAQVNYGLRYRTSGSVTFHVGNESASSSVYACTSSSALTLNKWSFVVGKYERGVGIKIFINGEEATSSCNAVADGINLTFNSNGSPAIGSYISTSGARVNNFNGDIAHIGVWGSALSDSAIQALGVTSDFTQNSGNYTQSADLEAFYIFANKTGTNVPDESGNGNNISLLGSPSLGDRAPIFYQSVQEGNISVGTFTATDADGDSITYSLQGTDASLFSIDVNGVLSFNAIAETNFPSDNDRDNVFELEIVATANSETAYQAVNITLTPDTDRDGTPNSTDTDDDNDGVSDTQESIDGTDPLNALSFLDDDNDWVSNAQEVLDGTSTSDASDFKDTNNNNYPDYIEPHICLVDDFSSSTLDTSWNLITTNASGYAPQIVTQDGSRRLRMTDTITGGVRGIYKDTKIPANRNLVFDFVAAAHGGSPDGDGFAVVLSDYDVTPTLGSGGGALAYMPGGAIQGFNGAWLGIGLDTVGNFLGGSTDANKIIVRGSSNGNDYTSGYNFIVKSASLSPAINSNTQGHRYRIEIDSSSQIQSNLSSEQFNGSVFNEIISSTDIQGAAGQNTLPENFLISFTAATGANKSNHDFGDLYVLSPNCASLFTSISVFNPVHDNSAEQVTFQVELTRPAPTGGLTVDYTTLDGTALSTSEYTSTSGTLNFAEGEQVATVTVPVTNLTNDDEGKTFTLSLSNQTNDGNTFINTGNSTVTLRVLDTDGDGTLDHIDTDDDNDGVSDTQEATDGTDPLNPLSFLDNDNDWVSNAQETADGTDPNDADSFLDANNDGVADSLADHVCLVDDFNQNQLDSAWTALPASGNSGSFDPQIVSELGNGRLRLTQAGDANSNGIYKDYKIPADRYLAFDFTAAAHGSGSSSSGDGLAVILSDYAVSPALGATGGRLGYGPDTGASVNGFAGGWLGIGIDEFGNFSGDFGGPGQRANSVALRGSVSGLSGFNYIAGTSTLSPALDVDASGSRFRMTIDSSNGTNSYTTVERNTGSGFATLSGLSNVDVANASGQASRPSHFRISFAAAVAGATNNHDIDDLRILSSNCASLFTNISVFNPVMNAAATEVTFQVGLSRPAPSGGVTVDYTTVNGTALAGSEFTASSATLNFAQGEQVKTVTVSMTGLTPADHDKTFSLSLSNQTNDGNTFIANGISSISLNLRDTDGDGTRDELDTDDDGDGVPDSIDSSPLVFGDTDSDGDGVPDYFDLGGAGFVSGTYVDGSGTVLDTDADGVSDYAEAFSGVNDAPVFNQVSHAFSETVVDNSAVSRTVAVADINQDGWLDAVVGDVNTSANLFWYENDQSGGLAARQTIISGGLQIVYGAQLLVTSTATATQIQYMEVKATIAQSGFCILVTIVIRLGRLLKTHVYRVA